ncbi:MAG TPA: hypothetical protein VMK30_00325 [Pleomorphomonadaceae bacterium]|nr:hypothetical protein [Pleomorphomonadaceae bacterium]
MSATSAPRTHRARAAALTTSIVALTLVTGAIHLSLGGLMFTLNGLGYFALAAAFVVGAAISHPLVVRFSWLPRVALIGYALASIGAWMLIGGRYDLVYVTKGVEVALIVLVILDIYRVYGGPVGLVRHALASVRWMVASVRS